MDPLRKLTLANPEILFSVKLDCPLTLLSLWLISVNEILTNRMS